MLFAALGAYTQRSEFKLIIAVKAHPLICLERMLLFVHPHFKYRYVTKRKSNQHQKCIYIKTDISKSHFLHQCNIGKSADFNHVFS